MAASDGCYGETSLGWPIHETWLPGTTVAIEPGLSRGLLMQSKDPEFFIAGDENLPVSDHGNQVGIAARVGPSPCAGLEKLGHGAAPGLGIKSKQIHVVGRRRSWVR